MGDSHSPIDEHASTERIAAAAEAVVPASQNSWHKGLRLEAVAWMMGNPDALQKVRI